MLNKMRILMIFRCKRDNRYDSITINRRTNMPDYEHIKEKFKLWIDCTSPDELIEDMEKYGFEFEKQGTMKDSRTFIIRRDGQKYEVEYIPSFFRYPEALVVEVDDKIEFIKNTGESWSGTERMCDRRWKKYLIVRKVD